MVFFSFGESPRQKHSDTVSWMSVVYPEVVRARDMGGALTASATDFHP